MKQYDEDAIVLIQNILDSVVSKPQLQTFTHDGSSPRQSLETRICQIFIQTEISSGNKTIKQGASIIADESMTGKGTKGAERAEINGCAQGRSDSRKRGWRSKEPRRMVRGHQGALNLFKCLYIWIDHNKKIMFRFLIVSTLLVLSCQGSTDFFLSPPLPPTAFVGEYYTTTFRVLGLDNPVFKFEDLPQCFKGYKDGTIEGTPDHAGSYPAKVYFSGPGCAESRDIVIRIANSVSSTQGFDQGSGILGVDKFIVVNSADRTFTYTVGQPINLALSAEHGKAPYTWNFLKLPAGLSSSKEGRISGAFSQTGYYSFSASANDASGSTADCYYTFNVQPQTVVASNLIEVPNRNVPVQYDINQVEKQQLASTNAVYAAIKVVTQEQKNVDSTRTLFAKTTLALQMATSQDNNAQDKVKEAAAHRSAADAASTRAHDILEAANKVVELATTNVNNALRVVTDAKNDLDATQKKFEIATNKLGAANDAFINAEAQTSQAAQNAKAALTAALNAQNVYNLAFNTYTNAKKILADSLDKKTQANLVVDAARNALNLATQVNDGALSDLTTVQDKYKKAFSALDNANTLVSALRGQLEDAAAQLGVAKFNLVQANNNLFVAQARKEQADKATAMVRTQSSTLPDPKSTSTYIFGGCEQQGYPTIGGADIVGVQNSLGFRLRSGYTLLYGDCTSKSAVVVNAGDVINYVGYLKDGYVHATQFSRNN